MKTVRRWVAWAMAAGVAGAVAAGDPWPEITRECRPWAYNWWMGSAVDRDNLARELRRYRDAGLGGIHVIPIYGVQGAESRDLRYLGSEWMEMFTFAVAEAERLDLGVDLTTGSGWCFGGPCITPDLAGMKVVVTNGALQTRPAAPKVKRAAPGGEGLMLNPFYGRAMDAYLRWFAPFDAPGAPRPRAMYHDSFEYSGPTWAPDLPEEFARRRGYRIEDELEAFAGCGESGRVARVRCDYRETLSDMLLDNVFARWTDWCRAHGMRTRNQAHGAPVNLLDFYALADIPETEMFGRGDRDPLASGFDAHFRDGDRDPLISKFASSAAHVAGRRLSSAEFSTWMAEHFCETFEEWKCLADLLFLSGANHLFYHGCAYSPDDAAWPGWLFYASSEMNPRNPLWREAPALNAYIARCQSVLQTGRPDNDVLLYWPIHDLYAAGHTFQFTVHNHRWLTDEPLGATARALWDGGVAFDYVSDRLLAGMKPGADGGIVAPGGAAYRAVFVPPCRTMPDTTLSNLLALADAGATVIFEDGVPEDVPGLGGLTARRAAFHALRESLGTVAVVETAAATVAPRGRGRVIVGARDAALTAAGLAGADLVTKAGAGIIRRRVDDGAYVFVVNPTMALMDGWFPLPVPAAGAWVLDPLTGRSGVAETRVADDGKPAVRLILAPGHSTILRTFDRAVPAGPPWSWAPGGEAVQAIAGPWSVEFVAGGPECPRSYSTDALASWTRCGDSAAEVFAGTAKYRTTFDLRTAIPSPDADRGMRNLLLDLGDVRHVARVRLNGCDLGTAFMRPYRLEVPVGHLKPAGNTLEIEVTNLAANRIRDLDRRKIRWRIFRDINFVNLHYKPFDTSDWPVFESGLLGPVRLLRSE